MTYDNSTLRVPASHHQFHSINIRLPNEEQLLTADARQAAVEQQTTRTHVRWMLVPSANR